MLSAALVVLFATAGARVIEVEVVPVGSPQMAMWIEDASGRFVDTVMVTRLVGTYGLGNRPGRGDLGSGFHWPYGKREMALPVWAHRRGVEYDRLVFEDCHEGAIRFHNAVSSNDPFYCRPTTADEHGIDAMTCPTAVFNSCKGIPLRLIDPAADPDCAAITGSLSPKSYYPPRNDLTAVRTGFDWDGVGDFANVNDLDAVSAATPPSGDRYRATYVLPDALAPGRYTVWIEVSVEGDFNDSYHADFFHDPAMTNYGVPFLGQPSVVWRAEVDAGDVPAASTTADYAGYGSADGSDGDLRPPDATITTGAERLAVLPGSAGARARVTYNPQPLECVAPAAVSDLRVASAGTSSISFVFTAVPGARSYDARYAPGRDAITGEDDFAHAIRIALPDDAAVSQFRVDQLQPASPYTIAIRALAACGTASELRAINAATSTPMTAPVDACFIATAAYGSREEAHVVELRRFRDRVLMKTPPGRALVDLYYTLSPPLADEIRANEALRFLVRLALGSIVRAVQED